MDGEVVDFLWHQYYKTLLILSLTNYSHQEWPWMHASVCSPTPFRVQGVIGRSESIPSMSILSLDVLGLLSRN